MVTWAVTEGCARRTLTTFRGGTLGLADTRCVLSSFSCRCVHPRFPQAYLCCKVDNLVIPVPEREGQPAHDVVLKKDE